MNQRNYKWVVYFIGITIVTTIAVQLYWNFREYQINKQNLISKVQLSLDNSVEAYFASLTKSGIITFASKDSTDSKGKSDTIFLKTNSRFAFRKKIHPRPIFFFISGQHSLSAPIDLTGIDHAEMGPAGIHFPQIFRGTTGRLGLNVVVLECLHRLVNLNRIGKDLKCSAGRAATEDNSFPRGKSIRGKDKSDNQKRAQPHDYRRIFFVSHPSSFFALFCSCEFKQNRIKINPPLSISACITSLIPNS